MLAPAVSVDRRDQEDAEPTAQSGNYTIYVARFKSKELADKEAEKWSGSATGVVITKFEGWYRISIGRFETRGQAKNAAEKLSEAHKVSYYIGKVSE